MIPVAGFFFFFFLFLLVLFSLFLSTRPLTIYDLHTHTHGFGMLALMIPTLRLRGWGLFFFHWKFWGTALHFHFFRRHIETHLQSFTATMEPSALFNHDYSVLLFKCCV